MIVVYPDQVVVAEQRLQLLREERVYLGIGRVFFIVVVEPIQKIVKQGPERAVREPIVRALLHFLREWDGRKANSIARSDARLT